ncbi:hypothetical protein C0Z01_18550 [Photobacterium kishitanii]|uniref:Uncharacterized protein n=1 Tax=Photobacterium kishitanii TaxID=318456 RepID=A0A0B7JI99_9GAMM|nr:hypothetical protein [Photobacterium kishitanii]OBU27318.1 hypothetical protein AYY22_03525 [Photobacterium kishitanii]PSU99954.1 hypothetical protein C9J27_06830 [Photobacterium kishitanii]PSV09304.1 hypothetical protein C0W28_20305 [Photobacterium kishitanii]PSW67853.1 hypothetical protein C0Z01_18550 [Photobacterium kishitanii]CEO41013.1 exported hypothetical protein [Photobacterium kishitanii]
MKTTIKTIAIASLFVSFGTFAASPVTGWVVEDGLIGSPQVKQDGITAVSSFEKKDGKIIFSMMMVSDKKSDDVGIKLIETESPIMVNGKKIMMEEQRQGQLRSFNPKTEAGTQYLLNEFKTKDGVIIENLTYSTNSFNQALKKLK